MIKLRTTEKWLKSQMRCERVLLSGEIDPDTHDAAVAHAWDQAVKEWLATPETGSDAGCIEGLAWVLSRVPIILRDTYGITE